MRKLIYVFDAFCPWCYAFTPVLQELLSHAPSLDLEVLSGGMLLRERLRTLQGQEEAERLRERYQVIEERAGLRFGEAFFERIAGSGLRMNSEPPAIALAAYRQRAAPREQLAFIHALLRAIFWEGEDPESPTFYTALAERVGLDGDDFLSELAKPETRDLAHYDFALAKQLRAEAFPRLYLQVADDYFHLLAKGYADLKEVSRIIEAVLPSSD